MSNTLHFQNFDVLVPDDASLSTEPSCDWSCTDLPHRFQCCDLDTHVLFSLIKKDISSHCLVYLKFCCGKATALASILQYD